jgi:hypothetical protein
MADFPSSEKNKKALQTMQLFSGEEVFEEVNGTVETIRLPERKNAFHNRVHRFDWIVTQDGEYYQK